MHYSNYVPFIKHIKKDQYGIELTWRVKFDESAVYKIDESSCVNKLFGFCFGIMGVHKMSCRIGWSCNPEGKINIYAYEYISGTLDKHLLATVNTGEWHDYTIRFANDSTADIAEYSIDGESKYSKLILGCTYSNWVFGLGPYFGGHTKAPHKITIFKK